LAFVDPFRALRYNLEHIGSLSDVVAPPYDVIDAELQDALYKRHPANVVRLILNRAEPSDDSPAARYERAAQFLQNWQNEGVLQRDPQPAIYCYRQSFDHEGLRRTRSGFLARLRLEEFEQGSVFPHEETHSAAKADRLQLIRACQANLSPIFGLYPDEGQQVHSAIWQIAKDRPPIEATDHLGVLHQLWVISDPNVIKQVASWMLPKPIFIADGHHRYETALNYLHERESQGELPSDHPARFLLMMYVGMSDPGMIVLPTHRLFRGMPAVLSDDLRDQLAECFSVRMAGEGADLAAPLWDEMQKSGKQDKLAFFAAKDKRWLVADLNAAGRARMEQLAAEHSGPWRELGVSILHKLVMESLLGASHLPKPLYVHSVEEVIHHLEAGDAIGRDATGQEGTGEKFAMAALVMPATLDHVRDISRTGERMPAKSTYFYPKLLSGLVIHTL
jgi:uncharacterized protein (DUF1015 family)